MCALVIDQPYPAKYRSMIFCDESSQTERYFVLGALYFIVKAETDHKAQVVQSEGQLRELKERYGLFGRAKWEKVPPAKQENKLEGYRRLIRWFQATRDMRFKCMVVDTTKYPLDNRERWDGDPLIGYLKYYCTFLCTIMSKYPGHFHDITIDNYTFREGNDSQKLRDTVEGRYRNKNTSVSRLYRNCDLRTGNEEDSNLLQLIDLLTGAVAFSWNGGKLRTSVRAASMKQLVGQLEIRFKNKLDKPSYVDRFQIWEFAAKS